MGFGIADTTRYDLSNEPGITESEDRLHGMRLDQSTDGQMQPALNFAPPYTGMASMATSFEGPLFADFGDPIDNWLPTEQSTAVRPSNGSVSQAIWWPQVEQQGVAPTASYPLNMDLDISAFTNQVTGPTFHPATNMTDIASVSMDLDDSIVMDQGHHHSLHPAPSGLRADPFSMDLDTSMSFDISNDAVLHNAANAAGTQMFDAVFDSSWLLSRAPNPGGHHAADAADPHQIWCLPGLLMPPIEVPERPSWCFGATAAQTQQNGNPNYFGSAHTAPSVTSRSLFAVGESGDTMLGEVGGAVHSSRLGRPQRQDTLPQLISRHPLVPVFPDYRQAIRCDQDLLQGVPRHLTQQTLTNDGQAQLPSRPLRGKPTFAIKRQALQAGETLIPRKRTKLEEALQPRHGYSEFQIELVAPHSDRNARSGKKLTVDERFTRDKGTCIMCRSRKCKCVRSDSKGPCNRCLRALVVDGSEVNSTRLMACVTRFSDLPSLDSCKERYFLVWQLYDASYLQLGQYRLLTRKECHDLDLTADDDHPTSYDFMQRSLLYAQSLLAFLDRLSGARWLQTLTTERIDEAAMYLIAIALLHTSADPDTNTKLETHRDILEHYWILITQRLHLFASVRSIGNAVVETFLVDSRVRLAVTKDEKHQAERSKQEAQYLLSTTVDTYSTEDTADQALALMNFFIFALPSEEAKSPPSDEHSDSECSSEVDFEEMLICLKRIAAKQRSELESDSDQEDDEDKESSYSSTEDADEEDGAVLATLI